MARKEPFRTIAVRRRILEALEPMREKESGARLRPYSVNEFCEAILWDYATGKLIRAESIRAGSVEPSRAVTGVGGKEIWLDEPGAEQHTTDEHQEESRKKTRRAKLK